MGMSALLLAMAALLFRSREFWEDFARGRWPAGGEVLRAYAVPVIALVQLFKFPLVGEPRPAMFLAIATFLVDITTLYVVAGVAGRLLRSTPAANESDALAIMAYAMTPLWLGELFAFTGPLWAVLAPMAIAWSLLLAARGIEHNATAGTGRRSALLLLTAALQAISLFSSTAALRLFNS